MWKAYGVIACDSAADVVNMFVYSIVLYQCAMEVEAFDVKKVVCSCIHSTAHIIIVSHYASLVVVHRSSRSSDTSSKYIYLTRLAAPDNLSVIKVYIGVIYSVHSFTLMAVLNPFIYLKSVIGSLYQTEQRMGILRAIFTLPWVDPLIF